MERESDSPCLSHTYPGQEHRSPGRSSSWERKFRHCGAIPGRGLLLTAERLIEGMWGRRSWWEMPVKESLQPWKQGNTAESDIRGGAITIASLSPHACIGSWTIQRLAHQTHNSRLQSRTPIQGAPLSAWMGEATRRTGQRSLLISSYKGLEKRLW